MPLLSDGFRLFFLGASAAASLSVVVWLSFLFGDATLAIGVSPVIWHGQELLFGFAAALVAGFLLTAVGNWTGRRVAGPALIAALFAVWLVGRIAPWLGAPAFIGQVASAAFLVFLTVVIARPIVAARNVRNYLMVGILAAFAAAGVFLALNPALTPLHAAADVLLLMMVVVGARVIPFFTGRRLPHTGVVAGGRVVQVAIGLTVVAVAAGWLSPIPWLAQVAQAAAGIALLACLVRWRFWRVTGEPMLWILHLGYAWLAVTLLVSAAGAPPSVALHALTVGALGCLAIGMMTRVALGHSGRPIAADAWMVAAFVFVALSAFPRLAFPYLPFEAGRAALTFAGVLWSAGFTLYFVRFVPVMSTARR